ncbi:hypothetical protein Agabi119p4_644 [Agaricus bisporus var. burnettii]|uniref:TPR-like protein n=1 Tax=Agaricus bisporus var. burnettii TaxID=192524 RepID=A0A8H7KLC9_AGABI|nr:hypothetical protein Agabi119p4_644 [Agaricus bisporus var. burnettii]
MASDTPVQVTLQAESLPIEDRIREANARKTEGNDSFRKSDWEEALSAYESALVFLPKSTVTLDDNRSHESPPRTEEEDEPTRHTEDPTPKSTQENIDPEMEKKCANLRSILNANIGACYVKLGEHKKAVEACTRALADDPKYVKALQRRAASNDILDTWTSLTSAQEDYNSLLELLPPGQETQEVQTKLRKLKPRLEVAQKKETTEMLGKLKTLGDSVLGNFGLSTDNFKFEPNGQGGYSVNFQR